ncbi:unnamed protein product [Oncorhynchus mykiss]|uniref:Uncharacterized protein n=1 Tax=Oncorhynchus mykiss TaxID=8022 RepID=A0A060WLS7_ONCMY|nr:unnamed protein product [Oncorhynchus mykiss]
MLVTRVLSFPTGWRCLTVAVQTPYPTCTALSDDNHIVSQWQEVLPGEVISFEFEARGKLRHRYTHELKLPLVWVGGWEQVKLVSVAKVVVFYRYATPDRNNPSYTVSPQVKGQELWSYSIVKKTVSAVSECCFVLMVCDVYFFLSGQPYQQAQHHTPTCLCKCASQQFFPMCSLLEYTVEVGSLHTP